jgi:ABC-2 type transport system ATP-binding protein
MAVIETVGVEKVYRSWWRRKELKAVDNLHLSVRQNCVFGFLGPNGAGKTTTIKLLLGLLSPTAGGGTVLGAPLGNRDIKERIGFLPDSPNFYRHLTARDFLIYCARLLHLDSQDYSGRLDDLLEKMGLGDAKDRKLGEFSRGMLQRVGIAQAMLNDPDLVILDEPLTGLDPLGRVEIKEIIQTLKREGKTVFFSSHILADVEQMCDEVGILNHGRLVCHGSVKSLLAEKEMTLWVEGLKSRDIEELEEEVETITKKKGQWGIEVSGTGGVEPMRQRIEALGGQILRVEGQRESLENFFLTKVEEDNKTRRSEG